MSTADSSNVEKHGLTRETLSGIVEETEQRLPAVGYASLRQVRVMRNGNVAVLRGRVPSYYSKQLAQEIARRLEGVTSIVNLLEVAGQPGEEVDRTE